MTEQYWNKRLSNPETTKIFSPNISEGVNQMVLNKDIVLPVINAIEDQNIQIRQQITKLSQQFKKLEGLSSSLLAENMRMRSHYYQRSNDLQSFVQTMKINLGSEITDITHQAHLLRQGNCLLFKNIQSEMTKTKQYEQRIKQTRSKLLQNKQNTTFQEEHVLFPLRVRLQNKLNSNTIRNLSQKQDKLTLNQQKLWSEISNLVFFVNQIEKQNISNTKNGVVERAQNQINKEHYKTNIIQALKNLNQLKLDLQQENIMAINQNQIHKTLTDKLKDLEIAKKKKNVEKEQKILALNKLKALRELQTKDFYESRKITAEMEVEILKKSQQRQRLAKILQNKRKTNLNLKQKNEEEKKALEDKADKELEEIRRKMKQSQLKFDRELEQLNQGIKAVESVAENLNNELKELTNDYQYYVKVCGTVQNPIKEIERAEFKLKYALNNRKPSSYNY